MFSLFIHSRLIFVLSLFDWLIDWLIDWLKYLGIRHSRGGREFDDGASDISLSSTTSGYRSGRGIHLFIYLFILSFILIFIYSFIQLSFHMSFLSFIRLFIHPFILSFTYSSFHPSIHSFIFSFVLGLNWQGVVFSWKLLRLLTKNVHKSSEGK